MRRWLGAALVLLFCTVARADTPAAASFDAAFDRYWGDQKGELAGYDLLAPRYGELRQGVAVTIFVTEPFSNSARVKADPGKHPPQDEFPVMKLNLVEDFPTGIYDYNLMTSVFIALKPINGLPVGSPTKVSFSAQEWCGQVYHQLLFDGFDKGIHSTRHSYFDGEADADENLPHPRDGISEDALLHWARGLAEPFMKPGESRKVQLLRSAKNARLRHQPLDWTRATLRRQAKSETIEVPAGRFECEVRTVDSEGNGRWTFHVERAHPHRLVEWRHTDGTDAKLLASHRLTYWQMHGQGFEKELEKLGLTPRPPRTP
ncbi:MAG: hypothetical protein ACREIT_09120 [Tepidisphaeraceae bacterium]